MSNPYNTETEVKDIEKLADSLEIILDDKQLNIGGERKILSPHKYVLSGTKKDGRKVILKCAKHKLGVEEIRTEHNIQKALEGLPFAEQELIMPNETFFGEVNGYLCAVTDYIEQDKVFTDHPLEEQFFMTIHALEAQETFHATTREHHQTIRDSFTRHDPQFYLDSYNEMWHQISVTHDTCNHILENGFNYLFENLSVLKALDGYLIHFDLVPHNFRIKDRKLYLLDFVSFRLGNKYEGWARFINFMEIHSPKLVPLLLEYVTKDRSQTEVLSLKLMRIYKAVYLLHYYTQSLNKTEGNLKQLTEERIKLWCHIIESILDDKEIDDNVRKNYYAERDKLRTAEEKERQRQFTWA